jgi:hypothetical protein
LCKNIILDIRVKDIMTNIIFIETEIHKFAKQNLHHDRRKISKQN